ncbi:putative TBC domain protein [Aspergillus saccharolyticus JOP 1030-1]|uniref:TBC domain protein n=1 Tax=Aspergillus saccharolyticus JOP 1030-1 TaxID=1450539 RepID=A0A318ZZL9_9EURO|nr:TBC domain protein [Aspergillus saccharolyticus JOP 1030-1]PYH45528.1 TBC domain protein [Aspergillus saccharolyticus JOP 1030-1]
MVNNRPVSVPSAVMSDSTSAIYSLPYDKTAAATVPVSLRSASFPPPSNQSFCSEDRSNPSSTSSGAPHDQAPPTPSQRPIKRGRNRLTTLPDAGASTVSLRSLRSIPSIIVDDTASRPSSRPGSRPGSRWSERRWGGLRGRKSGEFDRDDDDTPPVPPIQAPFNGIPLDIPNAALDGLGPQSMRFSKRGSLIKEEERRQLQHQIQQAEAQQQRIAQTGRADQPLHEHMPEDESDTALPAMASPEMNTADEEPVESPTRRSKPQSTLRVRHSAIASRAISADEDMLSRRVRLMYEKGDENVTDSEVARSLAAEHGVLWEDAAPPSMEGSRLSGPSVSGTDTRSIVSSLGTDGVPGFKREAHELAGGIEYWQNIKAGDVDRYGFIRSPTSNSNEGIDPSPIQRVSTSLLVASETPRRKYSMRPPSAIGPNRSFTGRSPTRKLSEPSIRPSSSQSTYSSPLRRSTTRFRRAANHLPHNRTRRVKDEAGDMLTLPTNAVKPGDRQDAAAARAARKKEWEREDKWTKMAKPIRSSDGGGMTFEFDTTSSKLIERTWKGIPDRWRATAWYAFLETSAKLHSNSPSKEELIEAFNEYQLMSSPDDVQIDIDVPRTITSHIMFRRRYRGGQRLLFRVLHAMSLYFPDTGYVQGMAALAATLLAYYDEEHAFIMLVRLWQLRGLERLYQSGFAGLMEALGDFEREWLEKGEVAAKLNELGIPPTAYGTRWYLTLFNYSIPFPAQLRVWDVFMLLGDAEDLTAPGSSIKSGKKAHVSAFGNGLDVLHATSAALIDGMRDIVLESDFENAMKVLTSWVPIKDVELFMRVAKTEWKVHRRKKSS